VVHFSMANLPGPLDDTFVMYVSTYLPTVQPLKIKPSDNNAIYFIILTSLF